jgi:hypothetical protein
VSTWDSSLTTEAAARMVTERVRQIRDEGCSQEQDRRYRHNQLGRAAAWYALNAGHYGWSDTIPVHDTRHVLHRMFHPLLSSYGFGWPFALSWWKPKNKVRDLERAGALIIAALEVALAEEEDRGNAPTG